jgi:hypothetical protein
MMLALTFGVLGALLLVAIVVLIIFRASGINFTKERQLRGADIQLQQ